MVSFENALRKRFRSAIIDDPCSLYGLDQSSRACVEDSSYEMASVQKAQVSLWHRPLFRYSM